MPFGILWPTLAMVGLIFVVWVTLFVQRVAHMRRNPPQASDFADGEAATRYFLPVEMPANNLRNLFEMPVLFFALVPVLFFALVPLLLITRHADQVQVLLAWAFVVLRAAHSVIHIGRNKVTVRFFVYLAACAVLSAMWIGFAVDMVQAAGSYHAAMSDMQG
ncbi:MAPEG family protein [Sphingomonas sp. RT2P30]|uniref:MAPEG family protein n=1 Tax=Parasphingomonas halimpatiens TaxID=3096162 RepID=UPI002FCB620D